LIARLLDGHARAVTAHPRIVAGVVLAVTVAAAALLPRVEIDPDVRALLPEDHPSVRLLAALERAQGSRSLLLLLRGEDLAERLPAIEEELGASPFLAEVRARREDLLAADPSRSLLLTASEEALEEFGEQLAPEARRAAIAESKALLAQDPTVGRELVLRDPLGLRWLLDRAARDAAPSGLDLDSPHLVFPERGLALVRVAGTRDPFDTEYSRRLMEDLATRLQGVAWEAFGGYDAAVRDSARIRGDLVRSLGWSVPALFLLLAWLTRSFLVPHLYVAPVALAVVWALGFGGAALGPLTPLAVSGAAILMGLGIDFSIHYLDRYREERRVRPHPEAVRSAHLGTGRALLLSMATTIAAFAAIALGSFSGLSSFGFLLSIGIVCAWLLTLSVAPLLASRAGTRGRTPPVPAAVRAARRLVTGSAGRWCATAVVALAVGGWASAALGDLVFDTDPLHLRPEDDRLRGRMAPLEEVLGHSPLALRVWVPEGVDPARVAAGVEELIEDGPVARATGDFTGWPGPRRRRLLERFASATEGWFEGTLEDLARAGFRPDAFRPALEDLAERLRVPAPEVGAADFRREGRRYRTLDLHPARTLRGLEERMELRARVRRALGGEVLVVDRAGVGDDLRGVLAADLRRSLVTCALVVLLVVAGTLRRTRDVAAALLPVLCGLGVTLGGLALSGFPLHPGNVLALPLVLGIGVDDGIHLVLRWRQTGADPLLTTGTSIWRTTLTTLVGFGSLVFASSPAIASLGALAAVGTATCFLATVLVVPVVLGRSSEAGC